MKTIHKREKEKKRVSVPFCSPIFLLLLAPASISAIDCSGYIGTDGPETILCTGPTIKEAQFKGGDDTVTLIGVTSRTDRNNIYWLDSKLHGNPVKDGNDVFRADSSEFYWVFGFGGDDLFEVYNSEFNNLYGDTNPYWVDQNGSDTITIKNSTSYGYILGGNQDDTITITDSQVFAVYSGFSDIWTGFDYTPYDTNDTVILDNVSFTSPVYHDSNLTMGYLVTGRGNDKITFLNGGEVYYVTAGHGSDTLEVFDNVHFNGCPIDSSGDSCGIYMDVPYHRDKNLSESYLSSVDGDDLVLMHGGDILESFIKTQHGSDRIVIEAPVLASTQTVFDGGDDCSISDGHIDELLFDHWVGELNGTNVLNWERIVLNSGTRITFADDNLSVGYEYSSHEYGLIIRPDAILKEDHDFKIDGNLYNRGVIDLRSASPNTTLSVTGDYVADNATVYLESRLDDANPSTSDILVIKGNSSGNTKLFIDNIDGGGAATIGKGILLIQVWGNSLGTFSLEAPIVTGNYIYLLFKEEDGNWYLQSKRRKGILAVDDFYLVNDLQGITFDVRSNDIPGFGLWEDHKLSLLSFPHSGILQFLSDGKFHYIPEPDYEGKVSFRYQIIDARGNEDIATVILDVICATSQPNDGKGGPMGWPGILVLLLGLLTLGAGRTPKEDV